MPMIIIYGARLYGRTTRIPGVLFVSTRFIHVMFFPFVPRSSWVLVTKEAAERVGIYPGIRQLSSINWRSVLFAWVRASLVLALSIGMIVFATQLLLHRAIGTLSQTGSVLLALMGAYWLSYRTDQPTHDQVDTLAKDLPDALVNNAKSQI